VSTTAKQLVVLGCSATKLQVQGLLPAINLYDGPAYRVLRSYLREYRWPQALSVAILSAKYGLIGGLSAISNYDERMTAQKAAALSESVTTALSRFAPSHRRVELILGREYVQSINFAADGLAGRQLHIAEGPIGWKLNRLHELLRSLPSELRRRTNDIASEPRPLYFLPDWDDFLDVDFDFEEDRFSCDTRAGRREEHSIALMRPHKLCDGVLVSLAQHLGSKGLLKRVGFADEQSLAPRSVRDHFKLRENQWAFGDCGAFSYIAEDAPTISVDQAVSLYDLYEFDFGASVDHIPAPTIPTATGKITLSKSQRVQRVKLTQKNAAAFIELHRKRAARFIPVGIIQGLDADNFAEQLPHYLDLGYRYIALGGLVPRSDDEVRAIVEAVCAKAKSLGKRVWFHLFGIFRPSLQKRFRELGISSFDSATYFRKAWLRSDQNYLAPDGTWYAAIRVPPSNDPRTLVRLKESGLSEGKIKTLEADAMASLRKYARGKLKLNACLEAVLRYDRLLARAELLDEKLIAAYRATLKDKPWSQCNCRVCAKLGVDVLIFRGLNRNKRRGAHNTLQLFHRVTGNARWGK
jgi:hypothetical protein